MKVELINYTPGALELLLFTKETRLDMDAAAMSAIQQLSYEEKMEKLEYMRNTIQSSWEFVDYVFAITDVTRAFTHQLVRHRIGTSFAQQSQRTVDMSGFRYKVPEGLTVEEMAEYERTMNKIQLGYTIMRQQGAPPEDARGVLPTNVLTNIIFKANLRTLHDMGLKRLCVKTQGEFQEVFRAIRQRVLEVHTWADKFIQVHCAFTGSCCFPTFPTHKCPIKPWVYDPQTGKNYGDNSVHNTPEDIQTIWENMQ